MPNVRFLRTSQRGAACCAHGARVQSQACVLVLACACGHPEHRATFNLHPNQPLVLQVHQIQSQMMRKGLTAFQERFQLHSVSA